MPNLKGYDWVENLIGETYNQKLEKAILARHNKDLLESVNHLHENAMVAVVHPVSNKIKALSLNTPEDLITHNFGRFINACATPKVSYNVGHSSFPVTCSYCGSVVTFGVYYFTSDNLEFNATTDSYTYIKFGQGTVTPQRTDVNIGSVLGSLPEKGTNNTCTGNYGHGVASWGGAVYASGAGTVSEMGWFWQFKDISSVIHSCLMFHDLLGTPVPYSAGDKLIGVYAVHI